MIDRDEELLRGLPLRTPSSTLDARIEKLLAAPSRREGRHVSLWQCAAACAVCAASAFFVAMLVNGRVVPGAAPVTTEVHYIVETDQRAFDVFDWTKYPANMAPSSSLRMRPAALKSITPKT